MVVEAIPSVVSDFRIPVSAKHELGDFGFPSGQAISSGKSLSLDAKLTHAHSHIFGVALGPERHDMDVE